MSLLVTGASGLLGSNLVLAAQDAGLDLIVVSRQHALRSRSGVRPMVADLAKPGVAVELIADKKPTAVIHTAAATDVDACERDPDMADRINRVMSREVAIAAADMGARLVHISTDAVFGDDRLEHREDDPTAPCNRYGASKLAAEREVLAAHPEALVVRTTIYGWNALPKRSLSEFFVEGLARPGEVPGFEDAWMTPILVDDLADRLLTLVRGQASGILHVAGRECVTKADFGRRIAVAFGHEPDRIRPTRLADQHLAAARNPRACLGTDRAVAMGIPIPSVQDGITRFRAGFEGGRPIRLRGLLEGIT